jgi:hypothetical protein
MVKNGSDLIAFATCANVRRFTPVEPAGMVKGTLPACWRNTPKDTILGRRTVECFHIGAKIVGYFALGDRDIGRVSSPIFKPFKVMQLHSNAISVRSLKKLAFCLPPCLE